MVTALITGYLAKEVADNKHKSARNAMRYVRAFLEKFKGELVRIEVLMGEIYVTLKDEKGFADLKKEFEAIPGVTVDQPNETALIFKKEKARVEAEALAKS